MENTSICKLKVSKDTNKKPVSLANFSNGCLNFRQSSDLRFTSYTQKVNRNSETDNKNTRRILVAESKRLEYKGTTFEDAGYKSPITYFIGVRNKDTGKMKLYSCIHIHLKPLLKVAVPSENVNKEDMDYREKLDSLAINFGDKAKKRDVNARLKCSIDSTSMLNDTLENMTVNPTTKKLSIGSSSIDYVPPQNKQAKFPSEVYSIQDIITEDEEQQLSLLAETLLNKNSFDIEKWKDGSIYCSYVISHLERHADFEKVKFLLYYNFMVIFSKLSYSDIKKKDPVPSIPEPFKSKFLDSFTVSSYNEYGKCSRNLPVRMKDKLFAYMLVLALMIDNYSVNIPSVLDGLKRSLSSAITIAQALGCHVVQRRVNDSAVKFAELKIPLVVPSQHMKKGH